MLCFPSSRTSSVPAATLDSHRATPVTMAPMTTPLGEMFMFTIESDTLSLQERGSLVAAVLMWWPMPSPLPELPRLSYPGQMLYSFVMTLPMTVISVFIVYADHVLYPAYASSPRLWGLSPLEDQRLGGLIMWIPGGLFFYLLTSLIFFRWVTIARDDQVGAQVREAYMGSEEGLVC